MGDLNCIAFDGKVAAAEGIFPGILHGAVILHMPMDPGSFPRSKHPLPGRI